MKRLIRAQTQSVQNDPLQDSGLTQEYIEQEFKDKYKKLIKKKILKPKAQQYNFDFFEKEFRIYPYTVKAVRSNIHLHDDSSQDFFNASRGMRSDYWAFEIFNKEGHSIYKGDTILPQGVHIFDHLKRQIQDLMINF